MCLHIHLSRTRQGWEWEKDINIYCLPTMCRALVRYLTYLTITGTLPGREDEPLVQREN